MCAVYKALINRTAIIIVEKWHIAASALHNAAYPSRSVNRYSASLKMTLFNSVLQDEAKRHPLLILQSSLAQSSLPILRSLIVDSSKNSGRNVLFCLLYPPSIFVESSSLDFVDIHDWLDKVPGYGDFDKHKELLTITKIGASMRFSFMVTMANLPPVLQETSRVVRIIIDSIDTLASDKGSLTETYACLSDLYALVRQHPRTNNSLLLSIHLLTWNLQTPASFCTPSRPLLSSHSLPPPPSPLP